MLLVLVVSAVLLLVPVNFTPQPGPAATQSKTPSSANEIEVKGCVNGSMLTDVTSGRGYHLTGDKSTIRMLTKEHKGHVEIVTGDLRTERRMGGKKQKRVGEKTIISVGAAESHSNGVEDAVSQLKVKSVEHVADTCRAG